MAKIIRSSISITSSGVGRDRRPLSIVGPTSITGFHIPEAEVSPHTPESSAMSLESTSPSGVPTSPGQ